MFKLFKRAPAADKLKRHLMANVVSMAVTFEATYFGRPLNQQVMDKTSMALLIASMMKAGISGRRIQRCAYEVAAETEMDHSEIGALSTLAKAILPEISGCDATGTRLKLMSDILPGYQFAEGDAVWFDINIQMFLEEMSNGLLDTIAILQD